MCLAIQIILHRSGYNTEGRVFIVVLAYPYVCPTIVLMSYYSINDALVVGGKVMKFDCWPCV